MMTDSEPSADKLLLPRPTLVLQAATCLVHFQHGISHTSPQTLLHVEMRNTKHNVLTLPGACSERADMPHARPLCCEQS